MKNKFAERLKELRKESNIKQSDLGKLLSCDQSSIAKWETGICEPNYDILLLISDIFSCSTDYLLGKED